MQGKIFKKIQKNPAAFVITLICLLFKFVYKWQDICISIANNPNLANHTRTAMKISAIGGKIVLSHGLKNAKTAVTWITTLDMTICVIQQNDLLFALLSN